MPLTILDYYLEVIGVRFYSKSLDIVYVPNTEEVEVECKTY